MWGNEVAGEALSGGADSLIPIYLSLGFAQGKSDLLQAMSDYLARYGVALSVTQLKSLLLSRGNIVLLLDGFDEMASGVDYRAVPEILDKIHALQLTPGVRIILSGRSSFFRSEIEVGIVKAGYVVKLEPFDLDAMLTYVTRRDPGLSSRARALFDKHVNFARTVPEPDSPDAVRELAARRRFAAAAVCDRRRAGAPPQARLADGSGRYLCRRSLPAFLHEDAAGQFRHPHDVGARSAVGVRAAAGLGLVQGGHRRVADEGVLETNRDRTAGAVA